MDTDAQDKVGIFFVMLFLCMVVGVTTYYQGRDNGYAKCVKECVEKRLAMYTVDHHTGKTTLMWGQDPAFYSSKSEPRSLIHPRRFNPPYHTHGEAPAPAAESDDCGCGGCSCGEKCECPVSPAPQPSV